MSTKVYRYRVKSLNGLLNKQARAVNFGTLYGIMQRIHYKGAYAGNLETNHWS